MIVTGREGGGGCDERIPSRVDVEAMYSPNSDPKSNL